MPYLRLSNGERLILRSESRDVALPGIVQGVSVDGSLLIEEKQREEKGGKLKILRGYSEASVTVEIKLLPPNLDAQIQALQNAFSQNGVVNKVKIFHAHLAARRIREVIFSSLQTRDAFAEDAVIARLNFTEWDSELRRQQQKLDENKPPDTASPPAEPGEKTTTKNNNGKTEPKTPKTVGEFEKGYADGVGGRGFVVPGSNGAVKLK